MVSKRARLMMWNRTGTRSSVLERAQAQLSGQRFFNKSEDKSTDELQEYMDALVKKKNMLQVRRTYDDLSDISSDDRVSEHDRPVTGLAGERLLDILTERPRGDAGSRFLKKAPPRAVACSQSPTLTRAGAQTEASRSVASSRRGSQSAALSRLALIEDRFRNRFQAKEGQVADTPALEETPLSTQSSSEQSMLGSRFLKKKKSATVAQRLEQVKASRPSAPQLSFSGKGVSLDSDEEDMKRLLGGPLDLSDESLPKKDELLAQESPRPAKKLYLKSSQKLTPAHRRPPSRAKSRSPSPPSRGSPLRIGLRAQTLRSPSYSVRSSSTVLSPTPSPPNFPSPGRRTASPRVKFLRRSQSSVSAPSEIRSLDELFPDAPPSDDTISEKSESSDEFKINIMSLDDLVPDTLGATQKPVEKKKTKEDSAKKTGSPSLSLNVVLADDTLGEPELWPADAEVEYESDFESEIQTEADQSASEISEHLGQGDRDVSAASEVQDGSRRAWESKSERSASYSSRTEGDRSDGSRSDSRRGSYSRSSTSASRSDTVTPPRARRTPRQAVREAGVQTQTDGLSYTWTSGWAALGPSVGMAHVDPTPIASHVVSAEAVEALTAYSPAVFALNDMLRQQLTLTRQIMEVSSHLHASLLESLGPANYSYTTLEDTKEFIRRHKSPSLTVEEALEEVLQEMREYHYI
ncbi:hypothetical protein COCON_G00056750 [Conger conger]|uniref:DUF4614 domain-containing protein n=1 Tax=Conger conger TaxID=82655 RepID=A0A9Q1DRB0_CONCO|nr:hypothetical protein COCON_G00056750 [Conger conger]